MDRGAIEERARAEARARDELARTEALRAEVAELQSAAGPVRRAAAALAGSRLVGLLARHRGRRHFRLARRKRVLEHGAAELPRARRRPPPTKHRGPLWLTDLDSATVRAEGPALRQRVLAELLAAGSERSGRAARVLVGPGCPGAVSEALAELGLERAAEAREADVAILAGPDGELGFDWILSGERSLASAGALPSRLESGGAAALAEALAAGARATAFCIRIAARDWDSAAFGGDAALARSLARALGERGHQALLQVDTEAGMAAAECLDVLLVLRGRATGEPTPGRLNLIWQISHPEETSTAELDRYDRVLVASRAHARQLATEVRPPVEPFLQFTDPALFHPVPEVGQQHELAFVGNWRGEFRRIVWDALEAGCSPALYGRGWDLLAPRQAVAEHVPHDELARLYSSCAILLCDHWDDMRRHGFVSNRVFDALACETFVLADDNPALAEELPGAVETYASVGELGEKIERHLANPEERRQMARRGRAMVLADHTVERRAEQLLAIATAAAPAGGASARGAGARAVGAGPA